MKSLPEGQRKTWLRSWYMLTTAHRQVHQYAHLLPTAPDIFPLHDAAMAWGVVTLAYSGIEQAMKCLLEMRDICPPHSHHIGALFLRLASEERDVLETSHRDYRVLYPEIPYETAAGFLQALDQGYGKWRYILKEGVDGIPPTHPGWMVEIWSALNDMIKARAGIDHGLDTVLRRIRIAMQLAIDRHWHTGIVAEDDEPPLTQNDLTQTSTDYVAWIKRYPNRIRAYADLLWHEAQGTLDRLGGSPAFHLVLQRGLRVFHQELRDRPDPDFTRFVERARCGVLF